MSKCKESPDGEHNFTPDIEYDITGKTVNCEYCGEPEPRKGKGMSDRDARKLISLIDHYHGNELKDRNRASIQAEVRAIREFLNEVIKEK